MLMHEGSMLRMEWFVRNFLSPLIVESSLFVLDVGSYDVNGCYKPLFQDPRLIYKGLDLEHGPNVDIVVKTPYNWDMLNDESFDVIISGQTIEHIEFFWLTLMEMTRVLKHGGLLCIIAPRGFERHRYPIDCYRYDTDGMAALAKFVKLDLIHASTNLAPLGAELSWYSINDIYADSMLIAKKPIDWTGVINPRNYVFKQNDLKSLTTGFVEIPNWYTVDNNLDQQSCSLYSWMNSRENQYERINASMKSSSEIQSFFENITPSYKTIEDLWHFCKSYNVLYLFGINKTSTVIIEYLKILGITITGYAVSDEHKCNYPETCCDGITINALSDINHVPNTGFILCLHEIHYNDAINALKKNGFMDFFILREYDKMAIGKKIAKNTRESLIIGFSLVEHCNLGCKMCAAFSQLSDEQYLDYNSFCKDMLRLQYLLGIDFPGVIMLSGGESLLHPQLLDFISLSRALFPNANLFLATNGIKLLRMETLFWDTVRESNFTIILTTYPINTDYYKIFEKATSYQVDIYAASTIDNAKSKLQEKIQVKYPIDLSGNQPFGNFICCYEYNQYNVITDGKFHSCSILPFIHRFNKFFKKNLLVSENDYIDIHKVKDFNELVSFSKKPPPFCRYCDIKNRRSIGKWSRSNRTLDEYID